jgi:hypothetical protein
LHYIYLWLILFGVEQLSTGNAQLDTNLSNLKKMAQDELAIWVKTWPPEASSKTALVKARQSTAFAAANCVTAATAAKITLHSNVTEIAKHTTQARASAAVNDVFAKISEGSMSKAQLEAMFVFDDADASKLAATTLANTKAAAPAAKIETKATETVVVKEAAAEKTAATITAKTDAAKEMITPKLEVESLSKTDLRKETVAPKLEVGSPSRTDLKKEAEKEPADKELAELLALEKAEKAEKEANAKIVLERETAARELAIREAAELVSKEAAEKAAKEKAEKEAAEKVAKEKAEKEAADKAAKEAAEKAAKEKAEKEAAAAQTTITQPSTPSPTPPNPPSGGADTWDPSSAVGDFYSDIEQILTSLGKGLANAQRALDIGAIQAQKAILEDETLSGYGLTANWYVMPEAEFTMRMELGVSEEETVEGTIDGKTELRSRKMMASLSNAKYSNLYKSDSKQESMLKIKFVPVPMPAVVKIPNVLGNPVASARAALAGASVSAMFINEKGEAWTEDTGKVALQSIPGGEVMLAEKVLVVTVNTAGVSSAQSKPPATSTPSPSTPSTPPASNTTPAPAPVAIIPETELKIQTLLADLNNYGQVELKQWTKTWPTEAGSKAAIVKARQSTAFAAANLISVTNAVKAEVHANVTEMSKHTTQARATAAVNDTFDKISTGTMSKAQLEGMFVFDMPGGK